MKNIMRINKENKKRKAKAPFKRLPLPFLFNTAIYSILLLPHMG